MMSPVVDDEAARLPIRRDVWGAAFPEIAPLLEQPLDAARLDRYGTIRLERWSAGRVVIVGDAAHAMPSSIGKGASLGMRTAVALAEGLDGAESIGDGIAAWQASRRPVVAAAQDIAERVAIARTLTAGPEGAAYDVPLLDPVR